MHGAASNSAQPVPALPRLLAIDLKTPAEVVAGAWQFVRHHPGWTIMMSPEGHDHLDPSQGGLPWADAFILGASSRDVRDAAGRLPIPAVDLLERDGPIEDRVYEVSVDNRAIGRLAFEHLREIGLRRFAYLPWEMGPDSSLRQAGFERAAAAEGMGSRTRVLPCVLSTREWTRDLRGQAEIFASVPVPFGLFCFSDWLANLALLALQQAGRRVPEDVAVIGVHHDQIVCESSSPPLSVVDASLMRLGYLAAKRAIAAAERGEAACEPADHSPIRVAPRGVVARASTDLAASRDDAVAAALTFLRDAIDDERFPSPGEVARVVGVSRRHLDARFVEDRGRTIAAEIARRRMAIITQLLQEGELPLAEIAARVDCGSLSQLCRLVRRHTGMSPRAYQKSMSVRGPTPDRAEVSGSPGTGL